MRRSIAVALLITVASAARGQMPPPWQRTETREACGRYEPFRSPYFGDLHIHTRFSADASIFGTTVEPRQVYDFVTGRASITVSDDNEQQTRTAHIDRPLDFAAVTDHAEFFGEVLICSDPGSPIYDETVCKLLRQVETTPAEQFNATVNWLFPAGLPSPPRSLPFCTMPGIDCDAAAVSVWQEMQAAAEAAYDRTSACAFTSFIGYEHTASPIGKHLHRNVIFRNEHVPAFAASILETWPGGVPQGLWSSIEAECLTTGTGCDAVIIPHNSNLSGGQQWLDPADAAEAQRRQTLEPLVEIHQIKGNSECRYDRLAGAGTGTIDELCTFEQLPRPDQTPGSPILPVAQYPRRNLVRNTLEDGLVLEQSLGVNPFQLGFVGDTDTHNGNGGGVDEGGWAGGQGSNDASPGRRVSDNMETNPGGLTVVWAEENSRDALFSALKRRETYATSGTRPVVRFFAGGLKDVTCDSPTMVRDAYARGTPMGGELGPVRGARSPRFAVWAAKDAAGTDLQRIQIVKGWVDAAGAPHERVFDVAGDAGNGADVDPATCAPRGAGAAELCTVWQDPDFNRRQRAFYYARVLENPSCRWSTRICKDAGIDPFAPACATTAAGTPFANCCIKEADEPFFSPVIQERAWTSPVWYRPEGIAGVHGQVRFSKRPGRDRLDLRIALGRIPKGFNLRRDALTIRVTDDEDIVAVTVPPGTLTRTAGKRFTGRVAGIGNVSHDASNRDASVLTFRGRGLDLSKVARADHMLTVAVGLGVHRATHMRLWVIRGSRLVPEER